MSWVSYFFTFQRCERNILIHFFTPCIILYFIIALNYNFCGQDSYLKRLWCTGYRIFTLPSAVNVMHRLTFFVPYVLLSFIITPNHLQLMTACKWRWITSHSVVPGFSPLSDRRVSSKVHDLYPHSQARVCFLSVSRFVGHYSQTRT